MKKILSIALIAMVAMVGVFANGSAESSADGTTTLTLLNTQLFVGQYSAEYGLIMATSGLKG